MITLAIDRPEHTRLAAIEMTEDSRIASPATLSTSDIEAIGTIPTDLAEAAEARSDGQATVVIPLAETEWTKSIEKEFGQLADQAIQRKLSEHRLTAGFAPLADSYYMPQSFIHMQLASEIPQFPYDPARAQQLLGQAGWTRGSDGVLVDAAGQRFETESLLEHANKGEEPAVVLGDFNTLSKPKATEIRKLMESQGFTTPFPTDVATWRGAGLRFHADWIFVRGVRVIRSGVARPLNVSDHWPIWAEIELPI